MVKPSHKEHPAHSEKEAPVKQEEVAAVSVKVEKAPIQNIVVDAPQGASDKKSKKGKASNLFKGFMAPKEKKQKPAPGEKGQLAAFFTSINYIGMGKHRTMFIQSLATMLNAGLPLVDAISTLSLETRSKPMRKVLTNIMTAVENGSPLWRAMENEYFFTQYEVAMVRIGEEAGNLARNMEYLAIQQEKDLELRQKVKMAMIYPAIVLTLLFIIVMGLGLFVLPNLVQVLYSLKVELPLATRVVIQFTKLFNEHGTVFVPLLVGGFILTAILARYTSFRIVTQWLTFRIPGIGRLAREATIARFGVILGGLLQAGVPLVDSMRSLEQVTQIVAYRKFYGQLLERVNLGDSFSKSFLLIKDTNKILPVSVQQLIVTGERSGSLSTVLLKVADIYDKKASDTAKKLPVILEPMLLLFVGALVGGIAFAIITPIYSVVGNVGR